MTSPPRVHCGPAGRRLYAIGDIHGRLDLLDALLGRIEDQCAAAAPPAPPTLVFLGDLIDRGPDSSGVVDRLRGGPPTDGPLAGGAWVALMGNHESFLLGSLTDATMIDPWRSNGGDATIRSYLGDATESDDPAHLMRRLRAAVPDAHRDFLAGLPLWYAAGEYLFVHAGLRPGLPLHRQDPEDLIWIREPFLSWRRSFGPMVVHGHTPVATPEFHSNRIAIDTRAWRSGHLTALAIEGERRWVLVT